jgi:hypothetical protein
MFLNRKKLSAPDEAQRLLDYTETGAFYTIKIFANA